MDSVDDPVGELLIRYRGTKADWKSLRTFVERMARELAEAPFTVAIVSDDAIRKLNRTYRGKDCATDVLSFPSGNPMFPANSEECGLGDVIISAQTAARAAHRLGWSVDLELKTLALHGTLHLMGHDHETDRGQMARAERTWGRRFSLPQTLISRSYRKKRK